MNLADSVPISPPDLFGKDRAPSHDQRFAPLQPMRDCLHLILRLAFAALPADARILCVGAGTGPEVLFLASVFPQWTFTLIEPSAAMMDVCREKVAAAGFGAKCSFHEGFLDSLKPGPPFDAATALLVSQFLHERRERVGFFAGIAARLKPGGPLLNGELTLPPDAGDDSAFLDLWCDALRLCAIPEENIAKFSSAVALVRPDEIVAMLHEAGFGGCRPLFQSIMMRAWISVAGHPTTS